MFPTNKTILLLLTAFALLASCRQTGGSTADNTPDSGEQAVEQTASAVPQRPSLAWIEPVQLEGVETLLKTGDLLPQGIVPDSVTAPMGIQAGLLPESGELKVTVVGDLGFLSILRLWSGGEPIDVVLKSPVAKKKATLRLRDQGYRDVRVKGEMNAWDPNAGVMKKVNGIWEFTFEAPAGSYPYLFVADGKEMTDPKNPQKSSDGKGGSHSLLTIKQPGSGSPPQLSMTKAEGNSIVLKIAKSGAVLAFWECHRLETRREGDKVSFDIPAEAASRQTSAIRAFAQNESGFSSELLIPLQNGKVAQ
ncbi:MAG: hypothetical protein WA004_12985 [Saprospiraceae bacterium]